MATPYHSPKVQHGPQPPERCRQLAKCASISRHIRASACARVSRLRHGCCLAGAPAASSSQREHPGVSWPKTGPPHEWRILMFWLVIMGPS